MERRDFMKTAAVGVATVAVGAAGDVIGQTSQGGQVRAAGPVTAGIPEHPDMKYRTLGRTGERVSLVGLGGFHLAKQGVSADEAIRLVHAAQDAGINFLDNCWDYNEGESEVRLGRALAGGRRDRAFVMTKIDGRTAESAIRQTEESLRRLQTDHVDLMQFHEIIRLEDADRIVAPGGAMEAMLRAREQGKIRYIGFTGHKSPAIHRHMFEVADRHGFTFDSVMMPLNVMDAHFDSFEQGILPMAAQRGTGVIGMKAFGDPFILQAKAASPMEMLHYPMSLPVSVQVTGIDSMPILQQALEAVRSFQPFTPEQRAALLAKTAAVARDGRTERYKVSDQFDGTAKNPHWLG